MSFGSLLYHIVFSTEGRRPVIDEEVRQPLVAYLGEIVRELGGKAFIVGGTCDHVHLLLSLPSTISLSSAMRVVKANSSK